jgi:hypothetical protein
MAAITDPFVFNIAKGWIGYYASLPAANDALMVALLKSSGLETFETLADYDSLSLLLAGTSDEATFTNYARKTLGSITSVVDDTSPNNWRTLDAADFTYATAGGADNTAVGALVIYYNPDTTAGANDASCIPLFGYGYAFTPDGTDFTVVLNAAGFGRAQ